MKISTAGLDLIKNFEGYHRKLPNGDCTTYRCPAGVLTIGWGCTESVKEGMVWTKEQADEALARELAKFEAAVDRLVTVDLNQNQRDALVSFAYNCGVGALQKSTLLKKLNKGDYKGAASQFKLWNKGGGKVLRGLVDRRAREATLFLTPVAEPEEPSMPQAVDPSAAKPSAATVATGALTAGATASQMISGPPEAVTTAVTQFSAWQSLVSTGQSLASWGWEHWPLVGGIAGTMLGLSYLNSRRTPE